MLLIFIISLQVNEQRFSTTSGASSGNLFVKIGDCFAVVVAVEGITGACHTKDFSGEIQVLDIIVEVHAFVGELTLAVGIGHDNDQVIVFEVFSVSL